MTRSETIEGGPNEALMTTRQRLILMLLLGANFMLSADFSILNVALPMVGKAVGLGVDELSWVTTTFALPSAGLSFLFGGLHVRSDCRWDARRRAELALGVPD